MSTLYDRMAHPTCVIRMMVLIHAGVSMSGAALVPDGMIATVFRASGITGYIAGLIFAAAWLLLAVYFVSVDIMGRKPARLHHWRWLPKFVIAAIYTLILTTALSQPILGVTLPLTIGYILFSSVLLWICVVIVRRQHTRALDAMVTGPGAL